MKNKILFIIVVFVFNASAFAYNIAGSVVSDADGEAVVGISAVLKMDSVNVLMQTQTDANGRFRFTDVENQDVIVEIAGQGYHTWKTVVSGNTADLNLGTIKLDRSGGMLDEVTVTESRVIQKADRYVIVPSKNEIDRAGETFALLRELAVKMPGMRVNQFSQSITVNDGTPTVQINGRVQPMSKVMNLDHNDILRIEYRDAPDIRYGSAGIINFITKPAQEGGSVMAKANSAVTTNRNNFQLSGSYNYKKSEWTLNYGGIYRKSRKEVTNLTEQFIGDGTNIVRNQEGIPSKTMDFDNNLSLDYVYMYNPKTMFAATLSYNYHKNERNENFRTTELLNGVTESSFEKYYNNHYTRNTPSLNLYFRKSFEHSQNLEINARGTMSSGDYSRGMDYSNDFNQTNLTDNKSWAAGAEALYSKGFKHLTLRLGASYTHNYADNGYSENGSRHISDKLENDNIYAYCDISGNLKKMGYSIGVGAKYFKSSDMSMSKDFVKAKATVTFNYPFNKHFSANYLYMYDPSLPSLSNFSEIVRTVDDILLQTGNVNVKPSAWMRNRLSIRYTTGNFYSTAEASYSRTNNPIISSYSYLTEGANQGKFMRRVDNGDYDSRVNLQLSLGYQNLFNHLTLSAYVGWDKYRVAGFGYRATDSSVYSSVSANAYFGNWTIYASVDIAPMHSIYGTTFYKSQMYNNAGVSYKWKNWNFECSINNPLTKRGSYQKQWEASDAHLLNQEFCIKDFNNMVMLTVQYRINFGDKFKKANRSIYGKGIDRGVDTNY